MKQIVMARTAGFCFGVKRAVETVYSEIAKATGPVFTYGPIIHNETVIRDLEEKGVRIICSEEELHKLNYGTLIIRSHGVGKNIYDICREKGLRVVDATCPFVRKIHEIVQKENAGGRRVLIAGDPHHAEVEGIRGWGREDTAVVESAEGLEEAGLDRTGKYSLVSQTTFNLTKFQEIVDKIPKLGYDIHCYNTICSATQERQEEAGKIASNVDCMIVIGSRTSSNTQKLVEICAGACRNTVFIQSLDDLDPEVLRAAKSIGITAGASTPKHIIEEVQLHVGRKF